MGAGGFTYQTVRRPQVCHPGYPNLFSELKSVVRVDRELGLKIGILTTPPLIKILAQLNRFPKSVSSDLD